MTLPPRIVVGGRWQADLSYLLTRAEREPVDVFGVRAPIDLLLGGRNVTARLPDEPVGRWFQLLSAALVDLLRGRFTRTQVPFSESPWELAIQRDRDDALLWLYQVVPPGHVVTEARVPFDQLLDAARALGDDLIARARRLPPSRDVDDLMDVLRDAERALAAVPKPAAALAGVARRTVRVETRSSAGFTVTSEVSSWLPMETYLGELGHDRLALLAEGSLTISPEASQAVRLPCRPIVALEQLVGALEDALALDIAPGAPIELATGDEASLVLELGGGRALLAVQRGAVASWHAELEATDVLTVLLEHVDDVVAQLVHQLPALSTNEWLIDLQSTADALRVRLLRALGTPRLTPTPRRGHESTGQALPPSARDTSPYPFEADDIHRMRHDRVWSLRRASVAAVTVTGPGRWLVQSADALESIDLAEGRVAWRAPLSAASSRVAIGSARALVVEGRGGPVEYDLASGTVTSRYEGGDAARVAGAVQWIDDAPAWALWDTDGAVRALREGRELWRAIPRAGVAQRVVAAGAALLCVGADGALTSLDPATGRAMYRLETGGDDVAVHVAEGGAIVAASRPRHAEVALGVLDVATGAWRCREWFDGDWHGAVVDGRHAAVLVAVDDGLWLRQFDVARGDVVGGVSFNEAGLERAVAGLRIDGDHAIVTQPGAVRAFSLGEGLEPRWSFDAPAGQRLGAPHHDGAIGMSAILRDDDMLFLSTRSGRPVHGVAAFWEELAMLVVDERANMIVVERRSDGVDTVHGVPAVGVLATVSSR